MNKPKISDTFFSSFIAQYCEIMASLETPDTKSGVMPMVMNAYIVDADDEFFFLGSNPLEITIAVKRDAVNFIQIIEDLSEEELLLNNMPKPESEEGVQ